MRFSIAATEIEFSISAIENQIQSLGLSESIQLVETSEDAMAVELIRQGEEVLVNVPGLDFRGSCQADGIHEVLLKCCGYRKVILNGLSVKDTNGKRSRPVITIFVANTARGMLPDSLEYMKVQKPGPSELAQRERIYFSSEILESLLETVVIRFKEGSREYEIGCEGTKCFIGFAAAPMALALDFILDQTVNDNLEKHLKIARRQGVFESFLTGRVENLVFNKGFYRRIKGSKDALKELLEFVEHAPKFQDVRDEMVEELREFVCKSYPYEHVSKHQYLDVYRAKVPKRRCENSIGYLIEKGQSGEGEGRGEQYRTLQ